MKKYVKYIEVANNDASLSTQLMLNNYEYYSCERNHI